MRLIAPSGTSLDPYFAALPGLHLRERVALRADDLQPYFDVYDWEPQVTLAALQEQARGEPATFPLNRVIPGWTEGVQLMVVGEKRRFWIPEELAYKGKPGPQGTLVFDVELIDIVTK